MEKFFLSIFFFNLILVLVTKRVLNLLLVFEFVILKIFLIIICLSGKFEQSFCLAFLVIIVAEASIGLSLLVSFIRIGRIEKVLGFI